MRERYSKRQAECVASLLESGGRRKEAQAQMEQKKRAECLFALSRAKSLLVFLAVVKYQQTLLVIQNQAGEPTVQQQGRQ